MILRASRMLRVGLTCTSRPYCVFDFHRCTPIGLSCRCLLPALGSLATRINLLTSRLGLRSADRKRTRSKIGGTIFRLSR